MQFTTFSLLPLEVVAALGDRRILNPFVEKPEWMFLHPYTRSDFCGVVVPHAFNMRIEDREIAAKMQITLKTATIIAFSSLLHAEVDAMVELCRPFRDQTKGRRVKINKKQIPGILKSLQA